MKQFMKRFLYQSGIMSAAFFVLYLFLWRFFPGTYLSSALPVLIPGLFLFTAIVYYLMLLSAANRFPKFASIYMLLTIGKMLFYAVIILVYALINKPDAVPFIASFFILYIAFTVYEVIAFLRDLKQMKK